VYSGQGLFLGQPQASPVADGPDLAEKIDYFFRHPEEARRVGRLARQAVFHKGAARKHADAILRLL